MNTLLLVLSSVLGQAGEVTPVAAVSWQRDYGQARRQAIEAQKPLAVFLTDGENGMERLAQGGLGGQAKEILSDKYVCMLVDTATPEGKRLASAFEINGTGLVISDRDGAYQAFWHQGGLPGETLVRTLQRYGDQTNVRMTEVGGRYSGYPPISGPLGGVGGYGYGYADGGYGGGCGGGGCGSGGCGSGGCGSGHCGGGHCGGGHRGGHRCR